MMDGKSFINNFQLFLNIKLFHDFIQTCRQNTHTVELLAAFYIITVLVQQTVIQLETAIISARYDMLIAQNCDVVGPSFMIIQ